jgi:integrase
MRKEDRNPPGFKIHRDSKPPFKWRCYHRKSGEKVDIDTFPLYSVAFYAECDRILKLFQSKETKPGTLGKLIEKYRASDEFQVDLKPRTRADYQKCADYLKPIENTLLVKFDPPLVVLIRDKAAKSLGRKWGNYVKTFMSIIFKWGKERGYIATNPAAEIKSKKRPKDLPAANRPWQDEERDTVMAALPTHMKLPVALMMYCGLDPSDALSLPKNAIVNNRIDTRRGKTGVPVYIRAPEPLLEVMAQEPAHSAITLCANSRGVPWTYNGFSTNWDKIKRALEKEDKIQPGLTLKGLRHTVGTILAELGYDERSIADMLGHETTAMARHYSKRADRTRKMEAVVTSFEAEVNRRKTRIDK